MLTKGMRVSVQWQRATALLFLLKIVSRRMTFIIIIIIINIEFCFNKLCVSLDSPACFYHLRVLLFKYVTWEFSFTNGKVFTRKQKNLKLVVTL